MSNGILKRDMKLLDLSLLPTMSDITDFYNCGTLYDWTNENFKLYPNVDLTGKKVLTVTGSGDHVLNCVLKGATKIDAFDINVFAKYYSALKCAMISSYGYYTFRYKIDEIIDNVKAIYNYKNEDFFKKVSHYLTEEELMFWRYYCELNEKKLPYGIGFLDDGTTIKKSPCYGRKNYNMLKERLKSVSITYYDSDALEISDLLSENKYDYIYISNIIDRIKANNEFLEHSIVLLKNLSNILETNSTLFSYSFHGMNFINIDNGLTSIYDVSETNKNYPKVFSFTKR